jgi:Uncharacterized alpha/beta hydrolase domain (DUF2235)
MPQDGKRKLNGREAAQRARAMECLRDKRSIQCQGQVHVGLFFDGTGNNDKWVEDGQTKTQRARNKHSNVARLFDAHLNEPENGFFAYYMPGVGTPFAEIGDTSKFYYDNLGMGFGFMGADRINYGIVSILDAVHRYLTTTQMFNRDDQRTLINTISRDALGPLSTEGTVRWTALTAAEERLAALVRGHQRKVTQINVSLYGFSRGAALARACAFWLSQICEREGGGLKLAGVPLRIGFMGIFDTVAAVGLGDIVPFADGHMSWADGTQSIHPAVEECAHFMALHEQRASFPLEAAVGRANVAYPGMHSDVGGGYLPGEQGKAMPEWGDTPHLSQIPLLDMHFASLKGGVPMMTMGQIAADAALSKAFSTDKKLLDAYNRWLSSHGVRPGDAVEYTQAHARHYIRWRGALHAGGGRGVTSLPFFGRATMGNDRENMREADEGLGLQLRWLLERRQANSTVGGYVAERLKSAVRVISPVTTMLLEPGKAALTSYEKRFLEIAVEGPAAPDGCHELFADYVHDSRAGFRVGGRHEPIVLTGGYLRFRHVFKEEVRSESAVYGWANQGLDAGKRASNAVAQFFSDLWDATVATYNRARQRVRALGRAALNAASAVYQAAEREALRRYHEAERELYDELRKRYLPTIR